MKVLHVEAGRFLYGGARQVLYIMEGLHQRGMSNVLACPVGSDIGRGAKDVAQVHEMKMGGDLDIGLMGRLKDLIRQTQPDIVHLHSRRGADIWGAFAARQMKVPCVLSRRVDNPESPFWAKIKYAQYNQVIAISEGIRQVLISEGVPPDHVICVRSAVDPKPYLHEVSRAEFAREFNVPENALIIGVVAQLIERKGHRYVLEALPTILERFPQTQVLFFGKGPLQEALQTQIKEKGLDGHVKLAGFREDLPKWLGGLDLLLHPADMEGLGVSLLQASAAAVPIITSNAGGLPEAVADGISGELIPPGDVGALTQVTLKLLGNEKLRKQYGQAGRERIMKEFSIDAMVEGNLRVYEGCLAAYKK
ncbi:MAG: glycosyltransferase family 4 protein [Saezia sp.]